MGIREDAFNGKPIEPFIIDAHTHLLEYNLNGWFQNPSFVSGDAVINYMDRLGIDCIITAPHSMVSGYMSHANSYAKKAIERYPGRVYGYISICPNEGLPAVSAELAKYAKDNKFIGLKILPGYHGELNQAEYQYALDFANEVSCPVLCHVWGNVPIIQSVEEIVKNRSEMKLIVAHQGGGSADLTVLYSELIKQYGNIFMDICGSFGNTLSMEQMEKLVGSERLIYGSDMINLDPRYDFGRVVLSTLSDVVKEKILSGNFLELLKTSQLGRILNPTDFWSI